jgi:antitoxin ParD1/3/4
MPTQNVNLPDRQSKFIRRQVKDGSYQNASEVVRAGLRLLERQAREDELKLKNLRRLAQEGFAALDRGEYIELTTDSLDDFFDRIDQRVRKRAGVQ